MSFWRGIFMGETTLWRLKVVDNIWLNPIFIGRTSWPPIKTCTYWCRAHSQLWLIHLNKHIYLIWKSRYSCSFFNSRTCVFFIKGTPNCLFSLPSFFSLLIILLPPGKWIRYMKTLFFDIKMTCQYLFWREKPTTKKNDDLINGTDWREEQRLQS